MEHDPELGAEVTQTRHVPLVTLGVFSITAIITGLQFANPAVVSALQRDPARLAAGEWWRLITPLFIHPEGWTQMLVDVAGIAIVGPLVERRFGRVRWLALYFVSGLIAELISYAWEPTGGGSSIALCGLIGGLWADLIRRQPLVWPISLIYALGLIAALIGFDLGGPIVAAVIGGLAGSLPGLLMRSHLSEATIARLIGLAGLVGALILTALQNQHGPPILVGAGLALLLWRHERHPPTPHRWWRRNAATKRAER